MKQMKMKADEGEARTRENLPFPSCDGDRAAYLSRKHDMQIQKWKPFEEINTKY